MTDLTKLNPGELDKARADEAFRRASHPIGGRCPENTFEIYRELVVSNWTPPDPISPRLRAAREWYKTCQPGRLDRVIDTGEYDNADKIQSFLSGVAWAVEKAGPLVNSLSGKLLPVEIPIALHAYRQEIGDE